MSKPGDRLTVETIEGDVNIERTQDAVRLEGPSGSMDIPLHKAGQISQAVGLLATPKDLVGGGSNYGSQPQPSMSRNQQRQSRRDQS